MSIYNEYGIYGILNKINNKIYVGKTEMNFGDRRDCHFASLRGGYHINPHLQMAFNKYGEDNFEFIILFNCKSGEDTFEVNRLEQQYIKYYKDLGLAYNIGDGGDGGYNRGKHLSDEAKQKIGEKNRINGLGRKASEETKIKMSESQKKRYSEWSDEDRKKWGEMMSEKAKGYKWSEASKEKMKNNKNGSKYTPDDIRKIRKLYEVDNYSITEISQMLQIARPTIYNICTYRRWADVV